MDFAGLVPAIGIIPDITNAFIYTARGDYGSALGSGLAAVPVLGVFATGGKFLNKGKNLLNKIKRRFNPFGPRGASANTFKAVGSALANRTGKRGFSEVGY